MSFQEVTPIDLSRVPPPAIVEHLDYEQIVTQARDLLVEFFPAIAHVIDLQSEPARALLEVYAYREMLLRQRMNDAVQATMLPRATGADLDNLGATLHRLARQEGESDDRYRLRIALAAQRYSGGRLPGYRLEAMTFSADVVDAGGFVDRATGEPIVRIPIMATENPAAPELVARVQAHLDRDDVRQASDIVIAQPVQLVSVAVDLVLVHRPGPAPAVLVSEAEERIAAEIESRRRPGGSLPRSALIAAASVPGVERVHLISPEADVTAGPDQLVHVTEITVAAEMANA